MALRRAQKVLVTDKQSREYLKDSVKQLDGLPIEFRLGEHRVEDFTSADLVVISPAIPPTNELLIATRQAGVPVTLEIELFIERCPAKIIGVTATKGKSTMTSMLGAMLAKSIAYTSAETSAGRCLFDLPNMQPSDLVVLELSSYMLEHLAHRRWSPQVAVVGMIGRDHLTWHGGEEAYVNAKKNLVRFQSPNDFAVLNEASPAACDFADVARSQVVRFNSKSHPPFELPIAGEHNQLNAQATFSAARIFDINWDDAQRAMASYKPLPHRLELVHESNGDPMDQRLDRHHPRGRGRGDAQRIRAGGSSRSSAAIRRTSTCTRCARRWHASARRC